ncbi:MAG: hypothetical protein JWN66_2548 [Sphingomonas bacterium]|uniref:aspartyl protease family protein n=1 Tax=Sphingomonas bacterium TaxID=1895847 RepID=UPI0026196E30|nr:aspartyl protease family protein [Sphingomonas bacterium]MDB5705432.1 hypothetical protein [Sphingomonas bacterium]
MLTLLIAAPVAAALSAPAVQLESAAPEAEIALVRWRNRWAMEAEIGGKTRTFLLDTAGGLTLISADTARAAGCTPWGRLTGFQMMGARLDGPRCDGLTMRAGGLTLTPPVMGLIDMGKGNPNDAALDGMIALNLFEHRAVTIDFAAGKLTIESPNSLAKRTAGMRALPIRISREVSGLALAVLAGVPTKNGPLWMELDSGNGGTVLVSKPVAALVGMNPAAEGKQAADFAVVGDIRATTADAFTPDMTIDGNLGMPFLRNWVITLDLAQGRAWIGKPPVGPAAAAPLPANPDAGGQQPAKH